MPRGSATAIRDRAHGHVPEEPMTPEGETFVIATPIDEPAPEPERHPSTSRYREPMSERRVAGIPRSSERGPSGPACSAESG